MCEGTIAYDEQLSSFSSVKWIWQSRDYIQDVLQAVVIQFMAVTGPKSQLTLNHLIDINP